MESLIHADIFFLISTIALVIIAVVLIVALIYVVRILNDLKSISRKVKDEGEEIISDIHDFREHVKAEGFNKLYFFGFFRKLFGRGKSSHRSGK
ncbi:MAG TPA: hypothetical protein VFA52_00445 [Candidatus Paceibacterota bacterium]|nr:hypothetical protein [Candidatus Paceibacterota bacterium]